MSCLPHREERNFSDITGALTVSSQYVILMTHVVSPWDGKNGCIKVLSTFSALPLFSLKAKYLHIHGAYL